MERMNATVPMQFSNKPSNYDEVSLQQSLLFSDSLKELKNLTKQLYSAAEYFELSYTSDDQKPKLMDTLKDYAIKAFVNTVDHLGSVTCKVNDMLDAKVDEVSRTKLRLSCMEQRLRACQRYVDGEGLSQQSLLINTPKHHKRYILPVGETMHGGRRTKSNYQGCSLDDGEEWNKFKDAIRAMIRETPPSFLLGKGGSLSPTGKGHPPWPLPKLAQQPGKVSFSSNKADGDFERKAALPHRFPHLCTSSGSGTGSGSGSDSSPFPNKPTTLKSSRPSTPNRSRSPAQTPALGRQQHISEPERSHPMQIRVEKGSTKESEHHHSRSKSLLKSWLSRHKSKKDNTLYTYLDEY